MPKQLRLGLEQLKVVPMGLNVGLNVDAGGYRRGPNYGRIMSGEGILAGVSTEEIVTTTIPSSAIYRRRREPDSGMQSSVQNYRKKRKK